jgi:hypothetical protein
MKKTLLYLTLSLALVVGLLIPAIPISANGYTITVIANGSYSPPPDPQQPLSVSIDWQTTSPSTTGIGSTQFIISASEGTVTLTAPPTSSYGPFNRWIIIDNGIRTPQTQGERTITFNAATLTVLALYRPFNVNVSAVGTYAPPPTPSQTLATPIYWSRTMSPTLPAGSGTKNTFFQVQAIGGSTVTLTAPSTYTSGGITYNFMRWNISGSGQPSGQVTVNIDADADKNATALYSPVLVIQLLPPNVNLVGSSATVFLRTGIAASGIPVGFVIEGPNALASRVVNTDSTGKATFTYTGQFDGQDVIWAYLDADSDGQYDSIPPGPNFPPDSKTTNTVNESWVKNFFTGGGNVKNDKKVTWTFEGTVGVLPTGGAIGEFNLIDQSKGKTYHLDNISWLIFYGESTGSPSANHNAVRFRASGIVSDGTVSTPVIMVIVAKDVAEPGKDHDLLGVELVSIGGVNSPTGLIGQVSVPELPSPVLEQLVAISGGNFQVHDVN